MEESGDERSQEVGRTHSTAEALEQGEPAGANRGERGGKGAGQGEHDPEHHGPDTEPGFRVNGAEACTTSDVDTRRSGILVYG